VSIINTMLQDLDKRNGRAGGEPKAGDAIRSIKPQSPWHLGRNTVLAVVGLVAASLAGAWWVQQRNHGAQSSIVVPAPPVPVLANNAPPATSPVAPVANVAIVATTPAKVTAPASPAPTASASSASTPDKVDPSAPKAVAMSPKAMGGKTYSPGQLSANLLGEAVMLDQQGRQEEAKLPLQKVLAATPLDVQARQMLIQLQLDTGRTEEARALLAEGQRLLPEQSSFTLALARLKVDSGDASGAIQLLEAGQANARNEPQYHALLAALLLRAQRYDEAAQHYLVALRSDPANPSWLVGVGVAFEGVGKQADAAEAYRRADRAANLTPEMANFLSERLARLGR
jgi:MSHA biogenesis protein MshN